VTSRRLSDLAIGASASVLSVHGSDEIAVRLMEMGIVPGVEIAAIGTAPLGDPIEYSLRGYRLSLRRAEAERIAVNETR
jgi:ferrous iron transport protein A